MIKDGVADASEDSRPGLRGTPSVTRAPGGRFGLANIRWLRRCCVVSDSRTWAGMATVRNDEFTLDGGQMAAGAGGRITHPRRGLAVLIATGRGGVHRTGGR